MKTADGGLVYPQVEVIFELSVDMSTVGKVLCLSIALLVSERERIGDVNVRTQQRKQSSKKQKTGKGRLSVDKNTRGCLYAESNKR
jgi:hypothetical protein